MTGQTFYDPQMQGVDWQAVGEYYYKFVPDVIHWEDLAEILGEMMGELNASHQWALYIADTSRGDQTASLGAYYDSSHTGPGLRIKKVLPGGGLPIERAQAWGRGRPLSMRAAPPTVPCFPRSISTRR